MENLGMNLLRENLSDILKERDQAAAVLEPLDDLDAIKKGLKYSLISGKVDRRKLDEYTRSYGIDTRHKIKIIITRPYMEKGIKGLILYKNVVYKYFILGSWVKVGILDF